MGTIIEDLLGNEILEGMGFALAEFSLSLALQACNPLFLSMFRANFEDVEHQHPFSFFHESDKSKVEEEIRFSLPLPSNTDIQCVRFDGSLFWAKVFFYARRGPNLKSYILMISDITEEKRRVVVEQQSARFVAAGRVIGRVAHDSNNLITSLMGNFEFLKEVVDSDNPENAETIREIDATILRMREMNRDLLVVGQKEIFTTARLNLEGLVHEIEGVMRSQLSPGVVLKVVYSSVADTLGDYTKIQQVLLNLVINARDALPEGGEILIEMKNTQLYQLYPDFYEEVKPGPYVCVSISDSGVGIPPHVEPYIFDPYYTTKGSRGTGLGLSSAMSIVLKHEGHIHVYTGSEGTTFRVYLPFADFIPGEISFPHVSELRGNEAILVVEDRSEILRITLRMLQTHGYDPEGVSSTNEALKCLKSRKFDLLLTDIGIPGINGADLAKLAQALYPQMGILFMSGLPSSQLQRIGYINNDKGYISKPFTPEELLFKVRRELDL